MRKRRFLFGLLFAAVIVFVLRSFWLPSIGSWLNVSDPRLPVDYAVPLPGGNDTRPFAVAALVQAGLAERVAVLVNEDTPDVEDQIVLPMHQVTSQVLLLRGVPKGDILMLPGTSASTYSDIQIIGRLIEREPTATIAIVTSPCHTRRVRWTVDQILPRWRHQVCVIATYNDSYNERIWWQDEGGLREILNEYLKLIFYWLTYSSSIQRALAGGLILSAIVLIRLLRRRRRESNPASVVNLP